MRQRQTACEAVGSIKGNKGHIRRRVEEQFYEELGREFDAVITDPPYVQGWPFIEYHTFLVKLSRRPARQNWPMPCAEFDRMTWWPIEALPAHLHYGAKATIGHFRQSELCKVRKQP